MYTKPTYITKKRRIIMPMSIIRKKHETKPSVTPNTVPSSVTFTPKDDLPVTVTPIILETLCIHNTCSSHQTTRTPDTILNITIWNQPLVQCLMPNQQPYAYTRQQSVRPSTTIVVCSAWCVRQTTQSSLQHSLSCSLLLIIVVFSVLSGCLVLHSVSFSAF